VSRVAVVTGAARGIGEATAHALADAGWAVACLDVDPDGAEAVARALADGAAFACDVADEDAVRRALAAARERFGPVTTLVNNAGVNTYFDPGEMTLAEWEAAFAVDLRGAWLTVKHALADLRTAEGASVVNVASLHARLTSRGMFPYAAAKAGLVGLTRSLAVELGPEGIRVNAVSPGWTRTRLVDEWLARQPDPSAAEAEVLASHPLGRMATPEQVAAVITFLSSDGAGAMTGAEVPVDAGLGARFA
jgi:NAD(P)-dependent dehydrogenase (short-subunit alcohol dehydrogenase family)